MAEEKTKRKQVSFYPNKEEVKLFLEKNNSDPTVLMNGLICAVEHMMMADRPQLSDDERAIISNCLSGTFINISAVEYLEMEIHDYDDLSNGKIEYPDLVEKIKNMTIGQRYAMLYSMGLLKWENFR